MVDFCHRCGEELEASNKRECPSCTRLFCKECTTYDNGQFVCMRCKKEVPDIEW